ncbi:MAG: protein tyrosine phosphatase family protein [Halioglobus sp.]
MSIDQAYNFRKVTDIVSTAGVLSIDQLKLLGREGYEAVINLLPDDSEYAIENEASIVEMQSITYEHIPVDFSAPLESDYRLFARKMSALSTAKVLVHCAANYRASAFYAIYAHLNLGWSENQSREFMRSVWNLDDYPVWERFVAKMLGDKSSS